MKKILFFALVLALAVLVPTTVTAAPTTLKFLYYADATQAGYQEDMDEFIQAFKDKNPDIDLQVEILFSQAYHQKLGAYVASGQIPDVVYLWPGARDSSLLMHKLGLVRDLRPLLGADFLKPFNPAILNVNLQASKKLAELPQSLTYTTTVYTNKKLLADNGLTPPKTYAQMKAMVLKLKAKGIQTLLLPDGDKWPAQSCLFSTIAGRMVGDAFTDKVLAGKAKFTDPEFVAALAFYAQLFKDGVIDRSNMTMGYGDGPGLFASGKAAMFVDGDWRTGAYLTDKSTGQALISPEAQASDFAMINFPAIPGEKFPGVASLAPGVGLGITTAVKPGSDVEKAAVKLLKWYYGPEVSAMKLRTGAFIPSRMDVLNFEGLEPFNKMINDYKNTLKPCIVIDNVWDPSVFNVLNDGLQAIGLGSETPAGLAAKIQAAQDLLSK
ncbi:MAG TPA: extracellular solute-binding protein [Spirochaetia bacterium]|nr:extracellular solute-binding protein [Spirochaetia bacterium]